MICSQKAVSDCFSRQDSASMGRACESPPKNKVLVRNKLLLINRLRHDELRGVKAWQLLKGIFVRLNAIVSS